MKFISDHLIFFSFDSKEDANKILTAAPWSFDKCIMVLSRHDPLAPAATTDLQTVPFWVQVYDIPLHFRNREVAEQIYGAIGPINQPENPNDCDGGSFIRIRVNVNITFPLC